MKMVYSAKNQQSFVLVLVLVYHKGFSTKNLYWLYDLMKNDQYRIKPTRSTHYDDCFIYAFELMNEANPSICPHSDYRLKTDDTSVYSSS